MATMHIERDVTLDDVQTELEQTLGPGYHVNIKRADPPVLSVSHSGLRATVRARQESGGTTIKISGNGFILWRIANELVMTRKVAKALGRSLSAT